MLREFEKAQKRPTSARDKFLLAASAVQFAQRAFSGGESLDQNFHNSVETVISKLAVLPWAQINFPVANVLLSQTYADIFAEHNVKDSDRPQLLLESLFTFLNVIETNPELATEQVLRQIIESDAFTRTTAATPVELNYRANVLKIFAPANVTAVDLEPLQIVVYRGELIGGGFGPELWGLAYIHSDGVARVLLETGELVQLPEQTLCLATTKDYSSAEVPPYLLACARLFFPALLSQLKVSGATITKLEKNFGAFTQELAAILAIDPAELSSCESVLDRARWSSDHADSSGAVKTINIADCGLQVVINAQQAAVRPYITSMLVNANTGLVLMRLDTPREFSAYGIYLYPVGPASCAVISYPAA